MTARTPTKDEKLADELLRSLGWDINKISEEEQRQIYRQASLHARALCFAKSAVGMARLAQSELKELLAAGAHLVDGRFMYGLALLTKQDIETRINDEAAREK